MDDITLNLIVLAIFLLLGGGIFLLVRRQQAQKEQKIIRLAAERGWEYETLSEPLARGTSLKSPRWTFEAVSRSSGRQVDSASGSSNVSMLTTWHANAPGSTLLIGPRTSRADLGSLGAALSRQVLQLALGADADGLKEVQAGSSAFRERYMIWAQDPVQAETLLTNAAVESALLAWRGKAPLIKRTSEGLTIELNGVHLKKTDEILTLVNLGELLLGWK